MQDTMTLRGARQLATIIRQYWHDRGHRGVRVEHYEVWPDLWGVRSNLVGGKPPK